jgi:beta-galactosidase
VAAGTAVEVPLPALGAAEATGERWLTISAVLAKDQPWAQAGHEVAWAQFPIPAERPAAQLPPPIPAALAEPHEDRIVLGAASFDALSGRLLGLDGLDVEGPQLDVWRAPTDNDHGQGGRNSVVTQWRTAGLDRMEHRLDSVEVVEDALVVQTRVAPNGLGHALLTTYRWTGVEDGLRLTVQVVPTGEWNCPLPRLGLRMSLPAAIDWASWFGGGPGEAYADSRQAARIGRYSSTVDELQTPYVVPQENGSRIDVRWADLSAADGSGLRIEGAQYFQLTARRWTTEDLELARHRSDLVPRNRVYVNVDLAQNGLGSASCGPGVLPQYHLTPGPWTFAITFRRLPQRT